MNRSWRAYPAVINKKPDQQVGDPDCILVVQRAIQHAFADDHLRRNRHIVAPHYVFGFVPDADLLEGLGDIHRLHDGVAGDFEQHVARANPRVVALAPGRDVQRKNQILAVASGSIHPRNTIIWKVITGLLPEINEGAAHRRYRENEQQRADELGFKIPQAAVFADTSLEHTHLQQTGPAFRSTLHATWRRAGAFMRIQDFYQTRQTRSRCALSVLGFATTGKCMSVMGQNI
jgi:hypothetical protein